MGLLVCGKHARTKKPNLWVAETKLEDTARKLQALWRGYIVRHQLSLAGPGVLKRSLCHNEEDIITGTEKTHQHPFEYFAFEEGGKVWWFDIQSLLRWSVEHVDIQNPYTKQPLDMSVRLRLRELYHFRIRHGMPCISHESPTPERITGIRAVRFIQQMHEQGFPEIRLDDILSLSGGEIWMFMNFALTDMQVLASEHKSQVSRRKKYVYWIREALRYHISRFGYFREIQRKFLGTLLAILTDTADPFPYCFIFASALYRV